MRDWFKAAAINLGKALATAIAITLIVFALLKAAIPSTQFLPWLGKILAGDFGYSRAYSAPVVAAFFERLPFSLELIVVSFAIALTVGFVIAFLSSRSPSSVLSRIAGYVVLALESVPVFWLALMLQVLVALFGHGFPYDRFASSDRFDLDDRLSHLILPAVTLALFQIQPLMEYARSRRTAAGRSTAARDWVAGAFATFAWRLPAVIGATFIIEPIFAWPGAGRLVFIAADQGDFRLFSGVLLLAALCVLTLRFIAETFLPDDPFGVANDVA
ncbi:MAG TPA: ABC transporter permease [Candidatus Rubrimentiphilum sp.]|nr:ABC transporter permease [Candidatus Rubrimentiphilum sp.]